MMTAEVLYVLRTYFFASERFPEAAAAQREEEQRPLQAAQVGPLLGRLLRARRGPPLPRAVERAHRGGQQAAPLRLSARRVPAHQVCT